MAIGFELRLGTKVRWCGVLMAALDRRMDLLNSQLTARERGILILRAWCAGETPDERLRRYCPPHDKESMESFIRAFERGTGETHGQLVILLEWTATLEGAVSSLRISQLYDARMKALEAVAKRAVDPLPPPWKDERRVPIGWGVLKPEQETDYVPASIGVSPAHAAWLSGPIWRHCKDVLSVEFHWNLDTQCPVPGSYALDAVATVQSRGRADRQFSLFRFRRYEPSKLAECLSSLGWDEIGAMPYGGADHPAADDDRACGIVHAISLLKNASID